MSQLCMFRRRLGELHIISTQDDPMTICYARYDGKLRDQDLMVQGMKMMAYLKSCNRSMYLARPSTISKSWHRPLLFPPFRGYYRRNTSPCFSRSRHCCPPLFTTASLDHSKLCSPHHFPIRLIVLAATHITRAAACACPCGLARPVYNLSVPIATTARGTASKHPFHKANPITTVTLCLPVLRLYARSSSSDPVSFKRHRPRNRTPPWP